MAKCQLRSQLGLYKAPIKYGYNNYVLYFVKHYVTPCQIFKHLFILLFKHPSPLLSRTLIVTDTCHGHLLSRTPVMDTYCHEHLSWTPAVMDTYHRHLLSCHGHLLSRTPVMDTYHRHLLSCHGHLVSWTPNTSLRDTCLHTHLGVPIFGTPTYTSSLPPLLLRFNPTHSHSPALMGVINKPYAHPHPKGRGEIRTLLGVKVNDPFLGQLSYHQK